MRVSRVGEVEVLFLHISLLPSRKRPLDCVSLFLELGSDGMCHCLIPRIHIYITSLSDLCYSEIREQ